MAAVHRRAFLDDVAALLDLRRRSILELASRGLPAGEAETWAAKLTLAGMKRKLRELEIWVAELDGVPAGWGAIRGDYLEGLYTAPEFAGRGIASGMLTRLEGLMTGRVSPLCAPKPAQTRWDSIVARVTGRVDRKRPTACGRSPKTFDRRLQTSLKLKFWLSFRQAH